MKNHAVLKVLVILCVAMCAATALHAAPTNFEIERDPVTGEAILSWDGGNADIHYIDVDYDCTFTSETVVGDVASPWTDLTSSSVTRRFYRLSAVGSDHTTRTTQAKIDVFIETGYNILSLPFDTDTPPWASELVADIVAQGGSVLELDKWDRDSGTWKVHDPTWPVVDFQIPAAEGFFVKSAAESTWTLVGKVIRTDKMEIPMVEGYTQIGIPSGDLDMASDAVGEILAEGGDISEISWWDSSAGIWRTHEVDWPLVDFPLALEKGYFVKFGADFLWLLDPEGDCGTLAGPVFLFSSGGGIVTSGDYELLSIVGQGGPTGEVASGDFTLKSGGIYALRPAWP